MSRLSVRPVLQTEQFTAIRDRLAHYSGVFLDPTAQRVLTTGIAQRMTVTGLSLDGYVKRILHPAGGDEVQRLVELVLNHETIFFRNMVHMQALRDVVLPQLHRRKAAGEAVRIWSAGCATGEEPYSLAIMVLESLGRALPRPVTIWATDLSEMALEKAQYGVYRGRTLTNVRPELYRRYFEQRGDGWMVRDDVRRLVTFERMNLLEPFPACAHGVDIIFCQNVTIYFQIATFRNLVERFYNVLPEGGMLFLGFSETLWNVFDRLQLREIDGAFVYVKDSRQHRVEPVAGRRQQPDRGEAAAQWRGLSARDNGTRHDHEESRRNAPSERSALRKHAQTPLLLGRAQETASAKATGKDGSTLNETVERARARLAAGYAEEALELLTQLPLAGSHAPCMLVLMAQAHANRGDVELAVAEVRRALELDALSMEAHRLLGILYVQQGQLVEASRQFERARYLDPDAPLVSFHLAETYRQLQRREMALREYRNTVRKLAAQPPDMLLDGVAVHWLRETCERYIRLLGSERV